MKNLFYALKEHWQIYVGLLLGLIIGLLVGIGFADWKSLVKGFDSKVTDWVMSLCTIGILIGTWKAAAYAKKAAHQAQVQNNNIIISKIDDMQSELTRDINNITTSVNDLDSKCKSIIDNLPINFNVIYSSDIDKILKKIRDLTKLNDEMNIYKYRLFLIHIIDFKDFNNLTDFFDNLQDYDGEFKEIEKGLKENMDDTKRFTENAKDLISELRKDIDLYFSTKSKLSESIDNKYKELNGYS
jgi:uncharacterized 23.2 kDa protein in int-C1 intergenic region